ncbi:MAG: thioredoxin domain-containing protein [Acidimicrobiales bacterium]
MTVLDGAGWRSYPSWEVFGQQTALGCTLAVPVSRHDHWLGARGAPVTIVFYGDYTNAASRSVYADLKQIESLAGRRLAVVYRHLVDLDSDKAAVRFAEAAEAAAAQGLFWAAHDRFYRRVYTSSDDIATAADEIGLDPDRLRHDLAHRSFLPTVLAHRNSAHASDAHSAPRMFINEVAVPADVEVRDLWTLVQEDLRRSEEKVHRPKAARATTSPHDYSAWVARRRTRQSAPAATAETA